MAMHQTCLVQDPELAAHVVPLTFYHTYHSMPLHIISNNTKLNIPALSEDGYTVKEICCLLGIKKTLVYKTLSLYK
ncbi:hypothetical protein OG21DRAFT_1492107 [Imleria badia]|nr:hypothetical protein OG21DRAFT_1492107 [Imleria badia]